MRADAAGGERDAAGERGRTCTKQNVDAYTTYLSSSRDESAIHMLENPVEHGHIKHIDIWYHFLRDHSQRRDIVIGHISTHKK
jgi:hypothetical protein